MSELGKLRERVTPYVPFLYRASFCENCTNMFREPVESWTDEEREAYMKEFYPSVWKEIENETKGREANFKAQFVQMKATQRKIEFPIVRGNQPCLLMFNHLADMDLNMRASAMHSVEEWDSVILPVLGNTLAKALLAAFRRGLYRLTSYEQRTP